MKNPPGFIFPHTDTPKTHLILDPNRRRRVFRGVCNTPLHEYVKNLLGFIFPHTGTPKTHPILGANRRRRTFRGVCFCAPTRVRAKPAQFHISTHVPAKNAPDFTIPNRDTPKTHPALHLNYRRRTFRGVCFCALHRYVKNLADFRPKPSARIISGRMQYAPTRVHQKNCLVSYFRTRIRQKRTRFYLSQ